MQSLKTTKKLAALTLAILLFAVSFLAIVPLNATYAFADPTSYTVSFYQSATDSAPTTQTIVEGARPTTPTAPSKTGHTFKGWSLSATSDATLDRLPAIYAATSFYAVFTPIQYEITFVYYNDSGILTTVKKSVDYGVVPTAPNYSATVNGSSFVAWDSELVAANAKKTYTATYNHAQYTVSYVSDLGDDNVITLNLLKTGVDDLSKQSPQTREGYKFKGWSTEENNRKKIIDENYRTDGDVTLYAVYTMSAGHWFSTLAIGWKIALIAAIVIIALITLAVILRAVGIVG